MPEVTPAGRDLLDTYRARDGLARGLMRAYGVAHRAREAAAESLREYLTGATTLAPADVEEMMAALPAQGAQVAKHLNDDELLRQVREVLLPMAKIRVQRRLDQEARVARKKVTSQSKPALLRARQARAVELFGREAISARVAAVLVGPPALVDRAVAALRAVLTADPARRVVRCADADSSATWALEPAEGAVRVVTFFAPWWDSASSNLVHFRTMLLRAEEHLHGPLDALLVDDLARRPKYLDVKSGVPENYLTRAVRLHDRLFGVARAKGGVMVAGLKLREGESYAQAEMTAFGGTCRLYHLSEDDGLLYATDGQGTQHLIAEPRDSCFAEETSSSGS